MNAESLSCLPADCQLRVKGQGVGLSQPKIFGPPKLLFSRPSDHKKNFLNCAQNSIRRLPRLVSSIKTHFTSFKLCKPCISQSHKQCFNVQRRGSSSCHLNLRGTEPDHPYCTCDNGHRSKILDITDCTAHNITYDSSHCHCSLTRVDEALFILTHRNALRICEQPTQARVDP